MPAGSDPLTSISAMISAIEPGYRLVDGSLLRDLYIQVGDPATAATIEAGYRMVDSALLNRLAAGIGSPARFYELTGPRLIDGTPWKELASVAATPGNVMQWDNPAHFWDDPGLVWG